MFATPLRGECPPHRPAIGSGLPLRPTVPGSGAGSGRRASHGDKLATGGSTQRKNHRGSVFIGVHLWFHLGELGAGFPERGATRRGIPGQDWGPAHYASSCLKVPAIRRKTPSQSPSASWRNSRIVGYHGLSSRAVIHRQSGTVERGIQARRPRPPARWATAVSGVITRSSRLMIAAVSWKSRGRRLVSSTIGNRPPRPRI